MTDNIRTCVRENIEVDLQAGDWRLRWPTEVCIEHIVRDMAPGRDMQFGGRVDFFAVTLADPTIKNVEGTGPTREKALMDLFTNLVNTWLWIKDMSLDQYYREGMVASEEGDPAKEFEAQKRALEALLEKEVECLQ